MKKFKKRLEKLENIVKSLSPATLNNPLSNQVNAMHNPQSSEIRGFSLKFLPWQNASKFSIFHSCCQHRPGH